MVENPNRKYSDVIKEAWAMSEPGADLERVARHLKAEGVDQATV